MNELINDNLIDKLVDGELPEDLRRAVLERLEIEPFGWRRCALAFLEAQAWRQAVGEIAGEVSAFGSVGLEDDRLSGPKVLRTGEASGTRKSKGLNDDLQADAPSRKRAVLAWAASMAAALVVGWSLGGGVSRPGDGVGESPLWPAASSGVVAAVENDEKAARARVEEEETRTARHALDSGQMVRVLDLGELERAGYRIDETPGLVVEATSEGARLVGPASQVRIRYVGEQVY